MRIIVCDDNSSDLQHIISVLNECNGTEQSNIIAFTNPDDALIYIEKGSICDIAFLDIFMPQMTGVELAKELRANGFDGYIVFLTSVNDFASQAFKVRAFSYLLKPAKQSEVKELLDEIKKKIHDSDYAGFHIKQRVGIRFIRFSELVYAEIKDHHLYFNLSSGETISVYATLREYRDILLGDMRMVQNHRSYIINMDYVSACEKGYAVLWDNTKISIPQEFTAFQAKYLQWTYGRRDKVERSTLSNY